jgi:hypothetical protein
MAALLNPVIVNNGSPSPYGKGSATVIEGDFTASTSQATQVVGNLSAQDLVDIVVVQPVAGCIGFCYDRSGSTFSNAGQGIVSVKQVDGGTTPASNIKIQIRVFRNT